MGKSKRSHKDEMGGLSGGIMLIGLGILFLVDDIGFWPWILAVIGLASLPGSIAAEGLWAGLQGAIWMIGLAFLFALGIIWPGILILIGLSTIAGALVKPPMLETSKPKRGLPPDDAGDDYEDI
jgi:hypothetical protein